MERDEVTLQEPLSPQPLEWCLGWPLLSERLLDPDERSALEHEAKSLKRRGAAILVAYGAVCAVAFGLAIVHMFSLDSGPYIGIAFLTLAFGVLLALPAKDCLARGKALHEDLSVGTVKAFGSGPAQTPEEDADPESGQTPEITADSAVTTAFEVLPASGRVLSVNGKRLERWASVGTTKNAELPEQANIAAQWLQPSGESESELLAGVRELSTEEIEETALAARVLTRRRAKPIVVLAFFSLLGAVTVLQVEDPTKWVFLGALLFLDAYLAPGLLRALFQARGLRKDGIGGTILILRSQEGGADTDENPTLEVLPCSRLVWTVDGVPNHWRRRMDSKPGTL